MNKTLDFLSQKTNELFGIDIRSLALFRICLGSIIFIDLILRARDLKAHYTDLGVMPRWAMIQNCSWAEQISFHLISGDIRVQALFFLAAGLLALCLIVGYQTKWVTFLSWIFLVSLQARNFMVLHGADVLLRMLAFWSMFLPLGASLSMDNVLRPPSAKLPQRIISMGTIGIFAQIVLMYIFNHITKTGVEWQKDNTAVYYALSIDQFATPFGHWLVNFPVVLESLSYFVFWFELVGPALLFSPFFTGPIRTLAILAFASMHIGFVLSLRIGIFPWVDLVALTLFLPSWFWEKISGKIIDFHSLFSKAEQFLKAKIIQLPLWRPQTISLRSWKTNLLAAFFIAFILLINLVTLPNSKYKIPDKMLWISHAFLLDQDWNMFAPYPSRDDGWYVIPGKLKDGTEVDLFNEGKPVTWEKPPLVSATYKNDRWRKYMMNLWAGKFQPLRLFYGQYLCREWNTQHSGNKQLEQFEIYFMLERTVPPYEKEKPPVKTLIWKHWCFGMPDEQRKISS